MIAFLHGKIINKGRGNVILEVNNVGYKIYVNQKIYVDLNIGQEIEFYTYQNVREDAQELYGFLLISELEMFELLLAISGIGPKSALGVLSIASVEDIKESIAHGDSSLLTKVSGIGKKTAERVVLELQDKVSLMLGVTAGSSSSRGMIASSEEIDALVALGYSVAQARESLKKVDSSEKDSGKRIKEALKGLGR